MTREELFKKALADRKVEKEKSGNRINFQYDDLRWSALSQDYYKVYRLFGNPVDRRMGDAYSPKVVMSSRIVCDDGKQMKVNWPLRSENEGWILHKIYDKVMSYTWDKNSNSKIYHYQKKHPNVFNQVFKNGKVDNPYEGGWKPKQVVLWNAIDRESMDWHKANKKTCLISKKGNEGDGDIVYFDFGIPLSLYQSIFDDIVSYAGDFEAYDILIRKLPEKPWYKVFHAVDDFKKVANESHLIRGTLEFAGSKLTDEERSWEKWNIDKYTQITSYQKIFKRLHVFIQEVDAVFKTSFYEELQRKMETEKAEFEAKGYGDDDDAPEELSTSNPSAVELFDLAKLVRDHPDNTITSTLQSRKPKVIEKKQEPDSIDWASLEEKGFKGLKLLTPDEKKSILAYDEKKGEFRYSEGAGEVYACMDKENCTFGAPDTFKHCPKCGMEFSN